MTTIAPDSIRERRCLRHQSYAQPHGPIIGVKTQSDGWGDMRHEGIVDTVIDTLTRLIATYGYLAVGILILLESVGVPLPGETALLAAAAAAGTGQLWIGGVIGVAAVAAIVGDGGGYWLGRLGGRPFIERYGRWVHLDARKLERIEAFFARHGPKTVFFGRFIGVLRTYSALFAGLSRMPYPSFTLYNVLGGIIWATSFGLLGYVFGRNLAVVERWARLFGWGVLALVVLVGVTMLLWRWLTRHQKELIAGRDTLLARPQVVRLRARYRRPLQWLRARLTPGQYLGLHLTAGLLVSVGCLWLFGGLVEDIMHGDPLVRVDQVVATLLHEWATPRATTIFVLITDLGAPVTLFALSVIVAVVYTRRRHWLSVGTWIVALTGGEALNLLFMLIVTRPRPIFIHPWLLAHRNSFPSGHAMLS
ncbi:MAG TPA: VTT domain-containing protein, partial [Glaciihabitans sp.]|nr:VTT domain-containing protein [Glaciihabitans sp.]